MIRPLSHGPQTSNLSQEPRVGVYVCQCGGNISDVVDVHRVVQAASALDHVVVARETPAMCSQGGQDLVVQDLRNQVVDRVVIAACTPSLHEHTFREAITRAGQNPFLYEHVNIREQVSWCSHSDPDGATDKAIRLVAAGVAKVRLARPLSPITVGAERHVTVVGGGISGLRAASDLARSGMKVALLEKSPFLGGRLMQWGHVYPTDEKARDLVNQLLHEVTNHPNITVYTRAEIVEASGCVGDFRLEVKLQPRGVDEALSATDQETAIDACLVRVPSEQDFGLSQRKAIYRPSPYSYPRTAAIDWENCERCGDCAKAIGGRGIRLDASPSIVPIHTGAILLAAGYDLYQPKQGELGYGDHQEVITLGQLERLLDPEGPTGGQLEQNGRPIRNICLIHCVGSRQIEGVHVPGADGRINDYCSRVCCTATLRTSAELRRQFPDANVFELYQDIRSYGRDHERYYDDATRESVIFVRYRGEHPPTVSRSRELDGARLSVTVEDTLTFGEELEIPADLVVLATGMVPRNLDLLIDQLKLSRSTDGYLQEVHPKLRPVELAVSGVFVAGTCQAPMGIAESCASGSAAASKAVALLARGHIDLDPFRASVNTDRCRGEGKCVEVCKHQKAISLVEIERDGKTVQEAQVNSALCNGCGMCVPICPSQAIEVDGWHLAQFDAMVDALVADYS